VAYREFIMMRQPPENFGSDGDRNMWILRRVTEVKK
jgi:hypothetical protein